MAGLPGRVAGDVRDVIPATPGCGCYVVGSMWITEYGGFDLTISLILDEAVNIDEKRLLEHEPGELLHQRSQSSLLHGWHELIV
jgi:hypothetical protein